MSDPDHIPTEKRWTTEGFMQRYEEISRQEGVNTYMEAYLLTEAEHKSKFGEKRYANYDSFRNVRKKWIMR